MTLHAAIEYVIAEAGRPLTTREIADAVNAHRLYERGDGQSVPASQVGARIRNYPDLFTKGSGRVSLARNCDSQFQLAPPSERPRPRMQPIVQNARVPNPVGTAVDAAVLFHDASFRLAGGAFHLAPEAPGLYAIRIIDFAVLPEPFRGMAEQRDDRLIYIGEATFNLRKRLGQELWAKGHGTFFRSVGAILGYRPARASLINLANKRNYTFATLDEDAIVQWINRNLEVSWLKLAGNVHETEAHLIRECGPLLNISGNPRKLPELIAVREECRRIANDNS